MVAALRQHKTGFAGAGVTTLAATFDDPALAGSLLLWIIAGDKNVGTITQPGDTPNLPINDRTSNVSQALAWGTADGGETTLSGSVVTNVAGSQIWILEITDDGRDGVWARRSTSLVVDPGTDVTSVALGPAPAATQPGIGVAAVACDSVNTEGTVSWTNSWTAQRSTPSGSTQAGQWGAVKAGIPLSATESTTFSRSGGTADQHSGMLVVFGRDGDWLGSGVATMGALSASGTGLSDPVGSGVAAFGALAASGSGEVTRMGAGAAVFAALAALGSGQQVTVGAGVALFAALQAAGVGIDPPPTDLPLEAGAPVLGGSWRSGTPSIAATWRSGPAEIV